jgi:dTDP-4-dehydrorhamnose 3,5-epimerase
MIIEETPFQGLFVITYKPFIDERGELIKTINSDIFKKYNLNFKFKESYFSISKKNVFRGMHFQKNPFEHEKLVHVLKGSIIDILLDLRSESKTFGKFYTIKLNDKNRKAVYISKGFAHGFLSLKNNTIVEYHTTTVQNKQSEDGIKFNSFGYKLPIENPIISLRDSEMNSFNTNIKYF